MENVKFIKNGISKLPPGFRFQPTDEELVFQYLKCKILSYQLPASIIPEINVCNYDPSDLPGNYGEQDRYYFSSKETKYRNGNRMNRTTKSGYWKATGSEKKVIRISSSISNNNVGLAGIRKSLVFYKGKSPNGSRSDWIMHEYRLVNVESNSSHQKYVKEIGDWVVCRIFMKKRRNVDKYSVSIMNQPRFFDFMRVHNAAPGPMVTSSSSSTSTEVSSSDQTSGYIC